VNLHTLFQKSHIGLQVLIVGLLSYSALLVFELYSVTQKIAQIEYNRYEAVAYADELRKTSDDLSQFAHYYSVTGLAKYKSRYDALLKVRNGVSFRVQSSVDSYWDLGPEMRDLVQLGGPVESLRRVLDSMPNTKAELRRLDGVAENADYRIQIEIEAINAIDGKYKDFEGSYTIDDEPSMERAQALVFSRKYRSAKNLVVEPLNALLASLQTKLKSWLFDLKTEQARLLSSLPALLGLNIALVIGIFVFSNIRLLRYHNELRDLSLKDHLTGIPNRKYVDEYCPQLMSYHRRHANPVCVALLDIDKFKQVNDTHGHQIGDQILKHFSRLTQRRIRKSDVFARFGGEEFLIILWNIDAKESQVLLENLCAYIAKHDFVDDTLCVPYSVSIGWVMNDNHYNLEAMQERADSAMYVAKNKGRNRVEKALLKPDDSLREAG
jgi:diguanylate cyclase (GGDEF)-like protein